MRSGRISVLLLLAVTFPGCGVARLWEPSREEVLDRILPSAVQVVLEQAEGRRVRSGSGVALASRQIGSRVECFVVTAGHTVSGLVGQSQAYVVFGGHRGSIVKAPATVIAYRDTPEIDLALLRTQSERCAPARTGGPPLLGEVPARAIRDDALAVLDGGVLLGDAADAREGRALLIGAVDERVVLAIPDRNEPLVDLGVHTLHRGEPAALDVGQGPLGIPRVAV